MNVKYLGCLATYASAFGLALAAGLAPQAHAQSVAPDNDKPDSAGGPQDSQAIPGVRPAKSQPRPGEALPGGRKGPPNTPQGIRWTEDWSQVPDKDAPFLAKIRHLPLAADDGVYLSLGGEARLYYTDWHHSSLGLRANDNNDPVQSRLRLVGDLHLDENLRAFVELGDNREWGENFVTPPNHDKLDVMQAFIDVTIPLGDAGKLTVRPGRYEMPLGNGKLLGIREGLDTRLTYQGVRATYILPGKVSVDVFATRPVDIREGTFNDRGNPARVFHGVYVSAPNTVAGFGTDLYWYEMKKASATLREGSGADERDNFGARLWQRKAGIDFDLEANLQRGTFAGQDVRAWGVLFEGGYTFAEVAFKPRLGLRANAFSGDKDLTDGRAGTFVPANPRLPLISEAAFFNLSNLVDIFPSVTLKPVPQITVMAGPDFLWRARRADGVYIGSNGASFAPYAGSNRIGTDFNLDISWQVTRRFSMRLFETYFQPSDAFAAAGASKGNYFGILSNYKF